MAAYGFNQLDFTIVNGAPGLSAGVKLNGLQVEGIIMPAAWVAAGLSFAAGETLAGTYLPLVDVLGNEITFTVAAGKQILLPMGLIRGVDFLKLQSGTSAAPVNQTADRVVRLIARPYL